MKKKIPNIITRSVAALLIAVMMFEAAAPAVAFAADYKAGLTLCSGGVYVPKGTQCPDPADIVFFACMLLASAAALGGAALFSWYPPLALATFAAIFASGAVACPRISPPKPNLTASSVGISGGGTPELGSVVKFSGTIKNTGSVATPSSFSNRFEYRWGSSGAWITMSNVSSSGVYNGGSDRLVSGNFTLSKLGTLQIRLCADTANGVTESNEKDNCSSAAAGQLTVTPSSTLVPQPITTTGTLTQGATFTFAGKIKNTGNSLSGISTGRFCVDNTNCASDTSGSLGNFVIPAIVAGLLSPVLSKNWIATDGPHTVYFCVVGKNNCSQQSFTVSALAFCTYGGNNYSDGSHIFFNTDLVTSPDTCALHSQQRTCTSGVWVPSSPTYIYDSCSQSAGVPQSAISLSANNELVRQGESVLLTWSGGNSTTCSLTGTGGFSSSAISGSNVSSGIISQKTIFTLACSLSASTKQATVTINLIPTVIEI